jgi:hypothetical protein
MGGWKSTTTLREPHLGHRRATFQAREWEGAPARPYQCLQVELRAAYAAAAGFRAGAILAAVGAAHAHAPAERNASPRVSTPMGTFWNGPNGSTGMLGEIGTEPRLGG